MYYTIPFGKLLNFFLLFFRTKSAYPLKDSEKVNQMDRKLFFPSLESACFSRARSLAK